MAIGLKLGAGGCILTGGTWTFGHAASMNVLLSYHPYQTSGSIKGDDGVRMRRKSLGDLYIAAQVGFTKVTHKQDPGTIFTTTSDVLEVGGGPGYSYLLFPNTAIGVEGIFMIGTIMSDATTGGSSTFQGSSSFTFFF